LGAKNRELGDAITTVRSEAKTEIAAVKSEAKSEVDAIKADAKAEIAAAKEEANADISGVKEEAKEAAKEASLSLQARDKTIDDLKAKLKKAKADLSKKG